MEAIPFQDKLSFEDIFFEGNVKPIAWGKDFNDWPILKQIDYAKKLASAMNEAATAMQLDRDRMWELGVAAVTQQREAELARDIAKTTLSQVIIENNETIQNLQRELMATQNRVTAQDKVIADFNEG